MDPPPLDTGPADATLRSESLDTGNGTRSGPENDLSLPEPHRPIIAINNHNTASYSVHSLTQSASSYGERLMEKLGDNVSWYSILAAAVVGFIYCSSTILAIVVGMICYAIHDHIESVKRKSMMNKCQEYLDKSDDGKREFLTRINLTHLLEKVTSNKGNNEGSFDWFNELIGRFWPFLNPLIQKEIDQHGLSTKGPGIEAAGSKIKFDRLTLGDRAPSISHIKLIEGSRDDEIILDVQLLYYGNCLISFSRRALKIFEMKIGLKDIYFQANAKIILRPVLSKPPFVGGLIVTLIEPPLVDFEGFNLGSLADNRVIKNLIITVISGMLVEPNKLSIPLIKDDLGMKRWTTFPKPIALCYFDVIEIDDLPVNNNLLAKNQVFCIVKVGETFFQSPVHKSEMNGYTAIGTNGSDDRTSSSSSSPWRRTFRTKNRRYVKVNYKQSVPFHDFIDTFSIQVIDKDTAASGTDHGSLGYVQFQLSSILGPDINGTSRWLPLNHSTTGRIHFRIACLHLTSDPIEAKKSLIQLDDHKQNIPNNFPIGFLSLYIHEIRSFPGKEKEEDDQRPFVMVRFGGETFTSRSVTRKVARVPQKIDQSCHFVLTRDKVSRLIHIVILDSKKVSISQANKSDFVPIEEQILASRSFKITKIFDIDTMSFENTINMYSNNEPIIQVSMFLGITITKFDAGLFNNLKDTKLTITESRSTVNENAVSTFNDK